MPDCGNKRLTFPVLPSSVCPLSSPPGNLIVCSQFFTRVHFFKRTNFSVQPAGMNRFYKAVVLYYWLPPLFTEGETGSQCDSSEVLFRAAFR